eukprot:1816330-Alexandrium_andersonii.AAC.1
MQGARRRAAAWRQMQQMPQDWAAAMARPPGVASAQEAKAIVHMLIVQFEAHLHRPDEGDKSQDAGFVYML